MKSVKELKNTIRIINPSSDDWKKVKNLRLEALQNDPQAFGASYEEQSQRTDDEWKERTQRTIGESKEEILVVAEDGDVFVGMIGAFPKDSTKWIIKAMYVSPQYRGKGVSKKLVEEILKQLDADKRIGTLELSVNTRQEAAVKLYSEFGFDVVETLEKQKLGDGKEYDEFIMRRKMIT